MCYPWSFAQAFQLHGKFMIILNLIFLFIKSIYVHNLKSQMALQDCQWKTAVCCSTSPRALSLPPQRQLLSMVSAVSSGTSFHMLITGTNRLSYFLVSKNFRFPLLNSYCGDEDVASYMKGLIIFAFLSPSCAQLCDILCEPVSSFHKIMTVNIPQPCRILCCLFLSWETILFLLFFPLFFVGLFGLSGYLSQKWQGKESNS